MLSLLQRHKINRFSGLKHEFNLRKSLFDVTF